MELFIFLIYIYNIYVMPYNLIINADVNVTHVLMLYISLIKCIF